MPTGPYEILRYKKMFYSARGAYCKILGSAGIIGILERIPEPLRP